jgi:hypothetical protein
VRLVVIKGFYIECYLTYVLELDLLLYFTPLQLIGYMSVSSLVVDLCGVFWFFSTRD